MHYFSFQSCVWSIGKTSKSHSSSLLWNSFSYYSIHSIHIIWVQIHLFHKVRYDELLTLISSFNMDINRSCNWLVKLLENYHELIKLSSRSNNKLKKLLYISSSRKCASKPWNIFFLSSILSKDVPTRLSIKFFVKDKSLMWVISNTLETALWFLKSSSKIDNWFR